MTRAIAAVQTTPLCGDVDANIRQHVELVPVAAGAGAQVLVFPELSLTGYEMELGDELAFSEGDSRLAPLAAASSNYGVTLIVGAPARVESRLHIGAFILSPDGSSDLYTKRHLGAFTSDDAVDGVIPPAEATVFVPGERNPLVRFGSNTGAVAICADVWRPSHPRHAAERGAKTYFAGTFTIASQVEATLETLRTSAERHAMAVAFANYGAKTGGLAAGGKSSIWSEKGDLLAQLGPTGAGVVVAVETSCGWQAKAIPIDG